MAHPLGFIDGEYQDGEARGRMFFAGQSGYGKTTEAKRVIESCRGRVVFFDLVGTHTFSGSVVATQPGELKRAMLAKPRNFRVLYQPQVGDLEEHFRAVCQMVCLVKFVTLFVDELDNFCSPKWGDRRVPPEFYEICQYGRHRRIACIGVSRMPMQVARAFTSQCQEMRLFHMDEEAHLAYFKSRIDARVIARLPGLPKYQYMRWLNDGSEPVLMKSGKRV